MKITQALNLLNLDALPNKEEEIIGAFKELAKKKHPDVGGTEEEFQELAQAKDFLIHALLTLKSSAHHVDEEADRLKRKRDAMRDAMLKRRAVEDRRRNIQATWGMGIILTVIGIVSAMALLRPYFVIWMVEKAPVERMATVVFSDGLDEFVVEWEFDSTKVRQTVNGRFVEGRWLVGKAGMPIIRGAEFIVTFNASNPDYFVLKDEFISPETAEMYFNLIRHPMANYMNRSLEDPQVVCMYWSVLDMYGVDGLSHFLFNGTPRRKNWSHNQRTFQTLTEDEGFQKIYKTCANK